MSDSEDFDFDIDYWARPVEPLGEMATIISTTDPRPIKIQVNPDRGRVGAPYFKAFSTERFTDNTRVARLHFFDSGMEYHRDKYKDWKITNSDCDDIIETLQQPYYTAPQYTVWQMTCFLWNVEYDFINPKDRAGYMNGKFDEEFSKHPSYIPSDTPIPDGWEYDPPKSKHKRSLT